MTRFSARLSSAESRWAATVQTSRDLALSDMAKRSIFEFGIMIGAYGLMFGGWWITGRM